MGTLATHQVIVMDADDPRLPALLAERKRLGLEALDEVWEGVHHLSPLPLSEHGRIQSELLVLFHPLARAAGLRTQNETAVYPVELPDDSNYRGPDLVIARPEAFSRRGVEGRAALAVEIHSPYDEAFEKVPFYGRVGVEELLIIHRDTKVVRRWIGDGHQLHEVDPVDGVHTLTCLPVTLATDHGTLIVDVAGERTAI